MGALEIVAVCNRKNKLPQLWSERLPLSTARSLVKSNDRMLQTDFKKLRNKVREKNACNRVICAQDWKTPGNILHAPQHYRNIRKVLVQTCAGIWEEGGVSCTAGRAVRCLPTHLSPPAALRSCLAFCLSICWSLLGQEPPRWWTCYIESAGPGHSGLICGKKMYKGPLSKVSHVPPISQCVLCVG